MSTDKKTNLAKWLPNYWDDVREMDSSMEIQNKHFDILNKEFQIVVDDQFIITAREEVCEFWERMLDLVHDPETEDIYFRRERIINRLSMRPPMSLWWLRQRLDLLIGRDYYNLWMEYDDYRLRLETNIENRAMFREIILMIHRIIPANIVFILVPTSYNFFEVETRAFIRSIARKRMGFWQMGITTWVESGRKRMGSWQMGITPWIDKEAYKGDWVEIGIVRDGT